MNYNWNKQTLTVQDISSILKVGKNSAYTLVEKKEFNSIKVGTTIRISMEVFKDWLNKQNFPIDEEETFEYQSYTIDDIQKILGISKNPAYNLVKENNFEFIKLGKVIRISKKSFDQWLNKS